VYEDPRTGDATAAVRPHNRAGSSHKSVYRKEFLMLEWKARFLTLAISLAVVWDQLGVQISSNWNW
jgi:hypothetical protein